MKTKGATVIIYEPTLAECKWVFTLFAIGMPQVDRTRRSMRTWNGWWRLELEAVAIKALQEHDNIYLFS